MCVPAPPLRDADVQRIVETAAHRRVRLLQQRGVLERRHPNRSCDPRLRPNPNPHRLYSRCLTSRNDVETGVRNRI